MTVDLSLLPHIVDEMPPEMAAVISSFTDDELDQFLAEVAQADEYVSFAQYQDNPVGFGQTELGEVYTDDIIAVMESVRDYPVTIARSANATGKTHAAARIATWFYKCFPNSQVYTAAAPPIDNLEDLLWGELDTITRKAPQMFEGDNITYLNIGGSKQHFITGVTIPKTGTSAQREAQFSGKHAPHLLFIVDEGDAVPDEVYKGIESCMSGGHARLLIMFNPRHESGPVYRMERDRQANVVELSAFRHPNVISGESKVLGAVDREKTLRRINEWTRPLADGELPNEECFNVDEHCHYLIGKSCLSTSGQPYPPLKGGWRKIVDPSFFYMVLGLYSPLGEFQLISKTWIADARSRWDLYAAEYGEIPPEKVSPIMGQDVAEFGSDYSVAIFRYGGFISRPISWQGMDIDAVGTKATELYQQYGASSALVDATGVGAAVAPKMTRQGCYATGVKVASKPTVEAKMDDGTTLGEFGVIRDQLWWSVREWLRSDPGAMLPPHDDLLEELATPTYSVVNGKVKVMSKDVMKSLLHRSPDYADSLCLTFAEPKSQVLLYD